MKIKDVCSRFSSGDFISADKIYSFGNYPVYGGNGLRGYTDNYNFDGECAVIGRQGAYSGNVKFFSGKGHMTEHAIVAIGNENNNTRFLAYKFGLMNLGRYAGQSAQPGLSVETLLNLDIDLPSKDNQDKIATVLSYLDNKIELNKKINATLEAMAKILYNYWFVQFDLTDENGKPYKTSGGKMIYNAELGREIPADWEVGKLSDCIKNINTGLNPRDNFILNNGGDKKYVTVKNLTATGQIDFSNCDYIDVSSKNLIHKRSDISKDDILFASIAPLGRCFLIFEEPKDWEINESVFSIRSSKLVNEIFLYMYFKSNEFIKLASLSSTGSIFKGIRVETLLNINIAIPSKAILNKFKDKVNFALRKIHHYWKENQNLIALRDWLLPMLMNGQVNFKD